MSKTTGVIEAVQECLNQATDLTCAYYREYPATPANCAGPDGLGLHSKLAQYVRETYPSGLFRHQLAGLQEIVGGKNTMITTKTSSGKSLVFTLPIMNAYLADSHSCALFIYPQKALANDQLTKLRDMYKAVVGESADPNLVARYDGATTQDARPQIREKGQFVLTNPDMLHYGMLQYHSKWARFFRHVKYVVVDEAHSYRGVFGSSVAYILRRLRCICDLYGSHPTLISASATIDRPQDHMNHLTGLDFVEVGPEVDGSIQGRKKLWLMSGKQHHYQVGRNLTKLFVDNDLTCLTFCPSRIAAERLLADVSDSLLADGRVRVYRAGLATAEREAIEAGLRDSTVKGVFSTSALELGIDIGALDVVLCVGLPNTMMSLWQRAGRVARSGREGAIVFIAADTPLDTYFTDHPRELFERANEPLVINLQNRRLVCHHLACAIQEAGDESATFVKTLGVHAEHALHLRKEGRLSAEVFYSDDPHMRTPIRNSDARNYALMLADEQIGEIDPWHLLRESYPHAIYRHGGRPYRVTDIVKGQRLVLLRREPSRNETIPVIRSSIATRQVRAVSNYPSARIMMADFDVTERLVSIQERNRAGDVVKTFTGSQGLPPHRLPTEGISFEVSGSLWLECCQKIKHGTPISCVHAIERLVGGLFPVISGPCDTMDFSTLSEIRDGKVTWYLYDQVHDGIDLTTHAYTHVNELLTKAADRTRSCACPDDGGCFGCVRNPEEAEPSSKTDCISVLGIVCRHLAENVARKEIFNVDVLAEQQSTGCCPKCQAEVIPGARFCANCGERLAD